MYDRESSVRHARRVVRTTRKDREPIHTHGPARPYEREANQYILDEALAEWGEYSEITNSELEE